MALTADVRPADRLVALYNVALAGVWTALAGRAAYAPWLSAAHLAAACLPALLKRLPARPSPALGVLREFYPLIFIAAYWSELGLRDVLADRVTHDVLVLRLDLALFGVHPHARWMPAMPDLWFSEMMFFAYVLYYPLIYVPPIAMAWQGRAEAVADMILRLAVGYLGCYLLFLLFPVDGPSRTMSWYVGEPAEGLLYRFSRSVGHFGYSAGTAFPSSHVVGAVSIAYGAWRWVPRRVGVLLAIEAAGVVLATVYTQHHYAVDAVAGVLLALALQWWAVPVARRWLGGRAPLREMASAAGLGGPRPELVR